MQIKAIKQSVLSFFFCLLYSFCFSQDPENCITLDFCQSSCTSSDNIYSSLDNLKLKKGDYFIIKIINVNPYRYSIKIQTKNDTFKVSEPPKLFMEFMDANTLTSMLGSLAGLAPTGTQHTQNLKARIEDSVSVLEQRYAAIRNCNNSSIMDMLYRNIDCASSTNTVCFPPATCTCLPGLEDNTQKIIRNRSFLLKRIDSLIAAIGSQTNIAGFSPDVMNNYKTISSELKSGSFSDVYINQVRGKTYSNFLVSANIQNLSTYYSHPIQVRGDEFELSIEITPKSNGASEKKDETKAQIHNSMDSHSPITINVGTLTPASATQPSGTSAKAVEEFSLTAPVAVKTLFVNYRFRTSGAWYGYSLGFFVDGLYDESKTYETFSKDNGDTAYRIIDEGNPVRIKFGALATVGGGWYFGQSTCFLHFFAGPGITFEVKPQPRLFFGAGFGFGERNRISLNGGVAIGQVKRLSSTQQGQEFNAPPTPIYVSQNSIAPFFALLYTFAGK